MNFTYETQGTSTFLVYALAPEEELDSMIMGMMNNNKIEGVLPFSFAQLDQERMVKYNVSSRVSLEQYFNGIVNKKRLVDVLLSLAEAVKESANYMLDPEDFVWDKSYIFVDVTSSKADLVCLPVLCETKQKVDLEAFFKEMFFGVQFDQTENCDYVAKLLGFFNANVHFSLQEFTSLLKEIDGQKTSTASAAAPKAQSAPVQPSAQAPIAPAPQQPAAPVQPSAQAASAPAPQPMPGAVNMPGAQPIPGAPAQAKPAAGAANIPGAQPMPGAPAPQQQKKGFHLFDKKEKQPKQPKTKPPKGEQALPGRSIGTASPQTKMPGAAAAPVSVKNVQAQNAAPQDTEKQGIGSAYVTPAYNTQQGSFGGTVVLNAGNQQSQGTVVLNAQNAAPQAQPVPYLLRKKNGHKFFVSKGVVKIGSDASYVDYVVSDTKTISRSHAELRLKGANVYLVDCNSTNHSYVDNKMLIPNVEELLREGCVVKLADEEFEFHTS